MDWKDGAACPVLVTFDVDVEELWFSSVRSGQEEFGNLQTVSMGEYGARVSISRLLELLDEQDVPAGFFVPGLVAENYPEMIKRIHDAGHELGNHGYRHNASRDEDPKMLREEYERANDLFEELTGERPVGMRVPSSSSALDAELFAELVDMGFEYNSNLKGNDNPYRVETEKGDIVEVPWHWSLDDAMHFNFNPRPATSYQSGMSSPSKVYDIWKRDFDVCYDRGLVYHLVMHPQVIGRPHRFGLLEELLEYISGHDDIWFTPPRDLVRYLRESDQTIPAQDLPDYEKWNSPL